MEEKKKSQEGSPKKTSEVNFSFVKTKQVELLRQVYDEVDTKKLARSPLDSEIVSEEKIAEISKDFDYKDENLKDDTNVEAKADEPEQMDTDEPEIKKQK